MTTDTDCWIGFLKLILIICFGSGSYLYLVYNISVRSVDGAELRLLVVPGSAERRFESHIGTDNDP